MLCEFPHNNVPPAGVTVAVMVALSPEHTVELFTLTVGVGLTVTVLLAVAEQPFNV